MKLEPNMYIRTHFGIRKIKNIKKDNGYGKPRVKVIELDRILDTIFKFDYEFYTDEKVIKECKASYNIIDLIEVGDYVNGLKVSSVGGTYYGRKDKAIYCDYCENKETGKWTMIYDDEIKSIVTKEQFESMKYEVK